MRLSIGSAAKLGFIKMDQLVEPTTCYILLGDRCSKGCQFCSQNVSAGMISRIRWPKFPKDEVIRRLNNSDFKRVCLQCTTTGLPEVMSIVKRIKKRTSVSFNFDTLDEIKDIAAHVDTICIPLDAANKLVYKSVKFGDFDKRLKFIVEAGRVFPKKITTHLIAGLGESEQDICELLAYLYSKDIRVGLFSFTPVKGTVLENMKQPDIDYYRKIQINHFQIKNKTQDISPEAFMTSGCSGCNRPYFNESPKGPIYNYPRPLTDEEKQHEMAIDF